MRKIVCLLAFATIGSSYCPGSGASAPGKATTGGRARAAASKTTVKAVPASPAAAPLRAANELAGHGHYKEAVIKYKEALQADAKNAQAHHMYGRTLALMGLLATAVEEYRLALSLQKPTAELENDIGVALAANDEVEEAAHHLKLAVTLSPRYIAAWNNFGVALARLGDYRAARDAFQTSLKMQPSNKYIVKKLADVTGKLSQSKPFVFDGPSPTAATAATPSDAGVSAGAPGSVPASAPRSAAAAPTAATSAPSALPPAVVSPPAPAVTSAPSPSEPSSSTTVVVPVAPAAPVAVPAGAAVEPPLSVVAPISNSDALKTGTSGGATPAGISTSIEVFQKETHKPALSAPEPVVSEPVSTPDAASTKPADSSNEDGGADDAAGSSSDMRVTPPDSGPIHGDDAE